MDLIHNRNAIYEPKGLRECIKRWSLLFALSVLVMHLLPGCGVAVGPDPGTDLSTIIKGATRAQVEGVLGSPVEGKPIADWRLDTYEFDKGHGSGFIGPWIFPPFIVTKYDGRLAFSDDAFARRSGYVTIAYDRSDVVLKVYHSFTSSSAEESLHAAIDKYEKVAASDADWKLANSGPYVLSPEERFLWLCKVAHQGHPEASLSLARRYWYGVAPLLSVNHVRGYMWTLIALQAGADDAALDAKKRESRLNPEEIAEAERQAAEWQRNPTPCEVEAEMAVAGG
jgi:hypothetical protein